MLSAILMISIVICSGSILADDEYVTKSVAYVNYAAVLRPGSTVSARDCNIIANGMKDFVELGRFNVDALPGSVIENYKTKIGVKNRFLNDIKSVVESTIIDEIKNILSSEVITRSLQFESEVDREKFISDKAKEFAITSDDLKKIMNTGYICVPLVITLSKSHPYDGGVKYEGELGLAWYQVHISDDDIYINFIDTVTTTGQKTKSYSSKSSKTETNIKTINSLAKSLAQRLSEKTRRLEPFRLKQQITEISGSTIKCFLDDSQDISLDDKFYIMESVKYADENVKSNRVGYGRVSSLGDYKKNLPTYIKVIKSNTSIVPGMVLEEYALSHKYIRIGFQTMQYRITEGSIVTNVDPSGTIVYPNDITLDIFISIFY